MKHTILTTLALTPALALVLSGVTGVSFGCCAVTRRGALPSRHTATGPSAEQGPSL